MPDRPGLTPRRALYDVRRLRALPLLAYLATGVGVVALLRLTASEPEPVSHLVVGLSMFVCGFAFAIAVVTHRNTRHLGIDRYRTPWAAADREQFMAALMAVRLRHHLAQPDTATDALNAAVADVARFQHQLLDDVTGCDWTASVYYWLSATPAPLTPEAPAA